MIQRKSVDFKIFRKGKNEQKVEIVAVFPGQLTSFHANFFNQTETFSFTI